MRRAVASLLSTALLITGCAKQGTPQLYPLRADLSGYHRATSTQSQEAQKYFDQGLVLYYGFNHEAAIASFAEAAKLDSKFAMAWWGQAISAGPNINNPLMDSAAARGAWEAVTRASALAEDAPPVEQELIRALKARYAWPQPQDRKSLDIAYADSMRSVWQKNPNDADVGALFADAILNLRPWDLWSPSGVPRPETPEAVATLERVLSFAPAHIGACHFYVHTMEASPYSERALPAADSLRFRIPGAGHLVHMPSHIDIRLGHYDEAVQANQRAVSIDSSWARQGGFYTIYRAHNFHFLAYAAMFDGRKELALRAVDDMVKQIPMEMVRSYLDFMDAFMGIPTHVLVRFGMWDEIIASSKPPADLLATTAFWRYGRTVAYAASGRTKEAQSEFDSLVIAYAAVPDSRLLGNNSARTVLQIGLPMAEGELEYRKGNYEKGFKLLRLAVQRDDSLRYDEPWGWMMPVRHSLGALLLERGRSKEAEAVYREDLRIHPGNGWALKGLAECLHRTGRHEEAMETDGKFEAAWARSDIKLKASCFCRTKF